MPSDQYYRTVHASHRTDCDPRKRTVKSDTGQCLSTKGYSQTGSTVAYKLPKRQAFTNFWEKRGALWGLLRLSRGKESAMKLPITLHVTRILWCSLVGSETPGSRNELMVIGLLLLR
jgi:hypothetical protein